MKLYFIFSLLSIGFVKGQNIYNDSLYISSLNTVIYKQETDRIVDNTEYKIIFDKENNTRNYVPLNNFKFPHLSKDIVVNLLNEKYITLVDNHFNEVEYFLNKNNYSNKSFIKRSTLDTLISAFNPSFQQKITDSLALKEFVKRRAKADMHRIYSILQKKLLQPNVLLYKYFNMLIYIEISPLDYNSFTQSENIPEIMQKEYRGNIYYLKIVPIDW